jgi:hypothetical protein
MYSLEEAVEKLPPKVNFAFTPAEILGSWFKKYTMKVLSWKTKQSLST